MICMYCIPGIVMLDAMMPTPAPIPQFSSHSGHVCSTWGNYHFKTFDGDIYYFPGTCNYLFASHCKSNNEDFNIQIRPSVEYGNAVKTHITAILDGVVVEITNKSIMLDGLLVTEIPTERSRVRVDTLGKNIKITASNDISLIWNEDDSLLLKLNRDKYANQTCGLCGDFSGVRGFALDGEQITSEQFGNMQKRNGPTEECLDVIASSSNDCKDKDEICKSTLTSTAFSDCNAILEPMDYIDACVQDLCHCSAENNMLCLCSVFAEYSRQCTHSGGVPGNWRTPEMCPQSCPLYSMEYQECGSPCPNTCTNTESTMLCEDHCVDGCFCPPGTIFDDLNYNGCIRQEECSCVYNSETYTPGSSFNTPCRECTCYRGKWKCKELPCTGSCSVEGGSHIASFDGSRYSINGDCSYVLAKHNAANDFTVLVELRRSEIASKKSSLKSVILGLNKGETVLVIKDNGALFLNWMPIQLPIIVANMTIFWSTSFYINIHTTFDAVIQVQVTSVMQVYITLGPSYHDQTSGLCGNFNNIQSDDFKAISGIAEGTAVSFANTWKSNSNCPNIKSSYEDPCSQNLEKEKYAQHWCALLTSSNGPFTPCHSVENPQTYYSNCLSDTCSCEDSEECMCAALASYAYACAKKNVAIIAWRDSVCEKYTKSCKESQVYQYNVTRCQPTCRSRSNDDATFDFEFFPVEGCVCREGTYLNDNGDCVMSASCPCYYQGNVMESGEMVEENGITCTCERGHLTCMGAVIKAPVCPHPLVYLNCSNAPKGTKGVECQKSCHTLDIDCFSSHCTSGCVCPPDLVSDGNEGCISEEQCPCIHNEATYRPGDIISVSCNTCICKNRRWQCTHKPCLGTCSVYGDGHYITFDNKQFTFSGSCEYILAQDNCGENEGQSSFRVISENVPCGTTGTTCSKNLKFFIGGKELRLDKEKIDVVKRDELNTIPYDVIHRGMYLIIKAENGVIIMWDQKTTMHMKLPSNFQGKVCGICGNYDGNGNNDFTTRSRSVVENLMEFGNSWKTSPSCPNVDVIKNPCSINPYRKPWALRQCSIITSDIFRSCHAQVDPSTYYESCISDSCACDTGGDCECFCTTVALYAQACSENGICINWRTPTICPMFCDYYNDVGECEWHYKACGDKCMKTCRNPKGECLHELSGCEGCYPKCPPSRPFLDEDTMKCVAQCGCVDNGIHYNYGDFVPRNCYSCVCTMDQIRCDYNTTACRCTYEGKMYNYKDTIPYSNNEESKCNQMECDTDGRIVKLYKCTTPPPSLPLDFTTRKIFTTKNTTAAMPTEKIHTTMKTTSASTTMSTKTPSQCYWTQWFDVNHPTSDNNGGDVETFEIAKNNGIRVCKAKEFIKDIKCRSTSYRDIAIEMLPQKVTCNIKTGLVCRNEDNPGPGEMCLNYESQLYCCDEHMPTTMETSPPTTHMMTSSRYTTSPSTKEATTVSNATPGTVTFSTTSTKPTSSNNPTTKESSKTTPPSQCYWTQWFDVNHPTSDNNGGDVETFEIAKNNGIRVCKAKEFIKDIKCRSTSYRDIAIEMLPQKVTCNIKTGLVCRNEDNPGPGEMCLNYESQLYCCDEHMPTTMETSPPTTHMMTSSRYTTSPSTKEATTVSNATPGTVTFSTTSTKPTSSNNPTTKESSKTTPPSQCYWTQWFDVNHPTSDNNGGDVETFEIAKNNGIRVCKAKEFIKDIKCRSTSYRDIAIEMLPQKVTCNIKTGLVCRNEDNPGPGEMCLNYESQLYCCDEHMPTTMETSPPTTHMTTSSKYTTSPSTKEATTVSNATPGTVTFSTTSTKPTSSNNPTTKESSKTTPPSQCYWTQWFDVNHPTSDNNGGDVETFEIAKNNGIRVCKAKEFIKDIKCRSTSYRDIAIEMLPQKVTCNIKTGLVCRNEDNPGPGEMCLNYESQLYCCDEHMPTTMETSPPTTHMMTSSRYTTSPSTKEATTVSNATPGTVTFSTTSTKPTSSNNPTTKESSKTTPPSQCYWTQWFDVNHPTSDNNGGDVETFEIAKNNGIRVCKAKQFIKDIKCRSTSYRDIAIEMLPQKVTCNIKTGLVCRNEDNPGPGEMCLNYESQLYCCDEHMPTTMETSPPTTHMMTSSRYTTSPSTKEATTVSNATPGTVTFSTTSTKPTSSNNPTTKESSKTTPPSQCYWTQWFDVNHPTSDNNGGDVETFEIAKNNGIRVCKAKEFIKDIKCRSTSYRDIAIEMLPQKVTCNIKTGLVCRNEDNPGPGEMCLNYESQLYCCDEHMPTTMETSPPTTHMTTSSKYTTSPSTKEATTVSNATPGTVTFSTTSTKPTSSNNPTTKESSKTTPPSQCYWTQWFDVNHPTSDNNGGDVETFEIAKNNGIRVCKAKEFIKDIKCRSTSYRDIAIEMLPQKVTCNIKTGLVCRNEDNPGPGEMCLNYESQLYCCDEHMPTTMETSPPTTHMTTSSRYTTSPSTKEATTVSNATPGTVTFSTTSTKPTSSNNPTTKESSKTTPPSQCYWTQWFDVNHPTSDNNGGDVETFEIAKNNGIHVCKAKEFIKDIKCRSTSYRDIAIEMLPQKVTCNIKTGLVCRNEDNPGPGEMCLNYESQLYCCDEHMPTTMETSRPTTHMTTSSRYTTSPSTKEATTVSNATPGTVTFSTTSTKPTSSNNPTTKESSKTTPPSQCYWTQWFDVNHPTSDNNGGDVETFEIAKNNGIRVCKAKEFIKDIKCRSTSYRDIAIEMLPQKVTCNIKTGLVCRNEDNPGPGEMCLNYESQLYCCDEHMPTTMETSPPTTHMTTSSRYTTSPSTKEATTVSNPTPGTVTFSTTSTKPTSSNNPTTKESSKTTPPSQCYWTQWFDVNHPTSDNNGGDVETFEIAKNNGIRVCKAKEFIKDIKCRSTSYRDIAIEMLPQKVTCNIKTGLVCRNEDNHGPGEMCLNYESQLYCCDEHMPTTMETSPPTTHMTTSSRYTTSPSTKEATTVGNATPGTVTFSTTSTKPTSSYNPTTKESSKTTPPSQCYWTQWFDVNHPTSDNNGGDVETFEIAKNNGIHVCKAKEFIKDIKCRSTSYRDIAIEMLPQKVTCNIKTGLVCRNEDNPGPGEMCLNYESQLYCCDEHMPTTMETSPPTTHMTTSSRYTTSPSTKEATTVSNATPGTVTFSTTSTKPTSSNNPTTKESSKTTPPSQCYWTQWFDVNHPTSDNNGGDVETFEIAKNNGIRVCKAKEFIKDIKCRSTSYRDISIEMLPQKVTCNIKTGLVCRNEDNPGPGEMCLNYESQLYCCDEYMPTTMKTSPPTTHMTTSSRYTTSPSTKEATTVSNATPGTVTFSTTSTKPISSNNLSMKESSQTTPSSQCYWTQWFDVNHPTSDNNGGDVETFEIAKNNGIRVCKAKEFIKDIKCRSTSYRDIAIEMLPQKVTCNIKTGLVCRNEDNPGPGEMCLNYESQLYCCDEHMPTTMETSPPTTHMTTSSRYTTSPSTKEATTVSNATPGTVTFSTTSTKPTSSNNPTTKESSKTTPPSQCYWTQWFDVNHPTSDNNGGDVETFEIAKNNGIRVCKAKEFIKDIKCRSTSYRDIAIEMLPQKVTCNIKTGLVCRNEDNPGPGEMCLNYESQLYCCDEHMPTTMETAPPTTHMTTSSRYTTSPSTKEATTVSNATPGTVTFSTTSTKPTSSNNPTTKESSKTTPPSQCYWTQWFDVNHPTSDNNGGDVETFEIAKNNGIRVCKAKEFIKDIKCRSTSYRDIAIEMLPQKVTCNIKTGLVCRNEDNPGPGEMCLNYESQLYCCDEHMPTTMETSPPTTHMTTSSRYTTSPSTKEATTVSNATPGTVTFSTTSTKPTSSNNPTTKESSKTTPPSQCYWTQWFDVNHPTSDNNGGDVETFEIAKNNGIRVCKAKEFIKDIKCRSTSYRDISIEMLPQKVTCNIKTGLVCRNEDNPGPGEMCLNYESQLYCCDEYIPTTMKTSPPTTHMMTSSRYTTSPSTKEATTVSNATPGTVTFSTTSTKPISSNNLSMKESSQTTPSSQCYWTQWFDVNHPTSDNNGGDVETFEIAKNNGIRVCKAKEFIKDIKCRSTSYRDIAIEMLPQKVTCNIKTGLVCRNEDNPGPGEMCLNYESQLYCCDEHMPTTMETSPPTTHMTTSSRYTTSPSTKEATTVSNATPGTVTFSTTSTKPTSSNNPTTKESSKTTPPSQCYWTQWFDVNHPTSDNNGGDVETFEIAKNNGIRVCKAKEFIKDIKCRSTSYRDIAIEMLPQKVTCNIKTGLVCRNEDNPGPGEMCLNYESQLYCCDEHMPTTMETAPPTTHMTTSSRYTTSPSTKEATTVSNATPGTVTFSTTSTKPTSSNNPTTKESSKTTPPSQCYWTQWFDVNHPTSDNNGGDVETFEIAKNNGIRVCKAKEFIKDIKCRSTSYRDIAIEMLPQKVTCNIKTGLVCRNEDNPGPGEMCLNYESQLYCCDEHMPTTMETSPPTTHMTTSSRYTTSPSTKEATTVSNATPGTVTFSTTSTKPTSSNNPTTKESSKTTPPSQCYWTQWFDVNHPTSDNNGGDVETFEIAKNNGIRVCKAKEFIKDIKCRSTSYRDISIEMLPQKVTCNIKTGLVCRNEDNPGPGEMCLNYESQLYCCDEYIPTTMKTSPPTTHMTTSSRYTTSPSTKEATTVSNATPGTVTFSTTSTKPTSSNNTSTKESSQTTPPSQCYWTQWFDVNHPTSDKNGGDVETFEIAKNNGIRVCKAKEFIKGIKCRSTSYRDIAIEMLPQKVTCNIKTGLICRNEDNPGPGEMCLNYESQLYCCDEYMPTTMKTSPPTTQMTTSSRYTTSPSTKEATTVSNATPGTVTFSTTSTKPTSSNNPTMKESSKTTPPSQCYWTQWFDVNHPTSDNNGGDVETFEIAKNNGIRVCKAKEFIKDIKCRSTSYRDIAIEMLPQKVTCNIKTGLVCRNQDNPGSRNMCFNYEAQLYCCENEILTTMATSPSTTHMRTSSRPDSSPSTKETTTIKSTSTTSASSSHISTTIFPDLLIVCVYEGSKYEVGSIVPKSPESCEECRCVMENNGANVKCRLKVCQTQCPTGFSYQLEPGQCCGKCVKHSCLLDFTEIMEGQSDLNLPEECCQNCSQDVCAENNTVLIKPGKLWRPPGDNCTFYDCEQNKMTVIRRVMSCPVQAPLICDQGIQVNFTSSDGCCSIQYCEPRKCDVMESLKLIESEGCEANVTITNCGGYCTSISRHPSFPKMVEHDCTCCQPTMTATKKVDLLCADERKISYNYTDVLQCACRGAACVFTE
ncbi:uncharacterized protein LOC142254347 [Anomaloglossus baeobatrachus]|uniref:uncharacterized protein LOC142254347 n=1 Tax=Anomaloglossus baeobatrachus TaxID=238106 RepID=UPI003F4F8D13